MSTGIIVALDKYGRGTDLRFLKDSHVIVGYLPNNLNEANQLAGRSSRTMKNHNADIIFHEAHLDADTVK